MFYFTYYFILLIASPLLCAASSYVTYAAKIQIIGRGGVVVESPSSRFQFCIFGGI